VEYAVQPPLIQSWPEHLLLTALTYYADMTNDGAWLRGTMMLGEWIVSGQPGQSPAA